VIGRLQISTSALRHNADTLRALVAPSKCAFVVKSNAYGHGLVETALAIENLSAAICVYAVEEAVTLREGGITAPLLILGPVPPELLTDAIYADAQIALWDVHGYLRDVVTAARDQHGRVDVHVKINTGVNRYGLEAHDAVDAVEEYLRHPELRVAGVFSHLASVEELDSSYTALQNDRFAKVLTGLAPLFAQREVAPAAHIAASAAAMLFSQTRLDLVRVGIALYGLWPSPQIRDALDGQGIALEPALSFGSSLAVARDVAAGESIGYGGSYHTARATRVGVVPLGYADGIPRALSNTGTFAIDGALCPIVGRIAMNATMLDLTDAPNARVGSPVTLIGSDGIACVTVDDWAAWSNTINYEIVARLPAGLPRTFAE